MLYEIERMRTDGLFIDRQRDHIEDLIKRDSTILDSQPGLAVLASLVHAEGHKEINAITNGLVSATREHIKVALENTTAPDMIEYLLVNAAIALTRPEYSNQKWRLEVPDTAVLFPGESLSNYIEDVSAKLEGTKDVCIKIIRAARNRLHTAKALLVAPELFTDNVVPPDQDDTIIVPSRKLIATACPLPRKEGLSGRLSKILNTLSGITRSEFFRSIGGM